MQADHQSYRLAGGAHILDITLGQSRIETRPVYLPGQLDQLVILVENLLEVRAEQFE